MLFLDVNVNVDVVDVDVVGVGVRKASIPDSSWITSVVVKTIVLNDLIRVDLIFSLIHEFCSWLMKRPSESLILAL